MSTINTSGLFQLAPSTPKITSPKCQARRNMALTLYIGDNRLIKLSSDIRNWEQIPNITIKGNYWEFMRFQSKKKTEISSEYEQYRGQRLRIRGNLF
ncbi:hypothetical protein F511_40325 [Dorcoceras hygrometricum]|uniref:Uncharacterized protein n=1 Tax=Dorcoceras hygrometricum TaxID=472368 RepID=A0A2Z7AAN2_9LAMI|nr:hypothetical protein F511_40325 [Dorcoceras hygrometricum]